MSNKTQLPVEVVKKIEQDSIAIGRNYEDRSLGFVARIEYLKCATEYATKLHELQQEFDELHNDHTEAKILLTEVFQKHESGLLPDRFIYEKIKRFLNGE